MEEGYWSKQPLGAFQIFTREEALAILGFGAFTMAIFWPYWL